MNDQDFTDFARLIIKKNDEGVAVTFWAPGGGMFLWQSMTVRIVMLYIVVYRRTRNRVILDFYFLSQLDIFYFCQ